MTTCIICGVEFVGKQPHYPYECCGSHECRLAMKRASRKRIKSGDKRKGVIVVCLVCDKEFKSESRFIRKCPNCKHNQQNHPVGAEWWGKVI